MRSDQPLVGAFDILLNQSQLFKAIAEFADIEKEVWFFLGRCYKRLPIASDGSSRPDREALRNAFAAASPAAA